MAGFSLWFYRIFLLVLAAMLLFSVLLHFGEWFWAFDLLVHFRLQYAVLLLTLTVGMLVLRKQLLALVCAILMLTHIPDVISVYQRPKSVTYPGEGQRLKLLSINLLSDNGRFHDVISYIKQEDPDILILQEMTELWRLVLDTGLQHFQNDSVIVREDNFGIAAFTKLQKVSFELLNLCAAPLPSLKLTFPVGGRNIHLVATHLLPPVSERKAELRREHFAKLMEMDREAGQRFILVGDLNTSPYSPQFETLKEELSLVDSRRGLGIQPTWPTWCWPMSIPIDHCLVSPDLLVTERYTGPDVGSDHLPVVVEIRMF